MIIVQKQKTQKLPWFKEWFNSEYYHKLYANRDETEAKNFIDALTTKLNPAKHSTMIDVGCGAGRHSIYLASKSFNVTGIDTAYASIQQAKLFENGRLHFKEHDMRIPFGSNCFDYVFNFFTSFGYFNSQHENNLVIENMSAALKQQGVIVIDYLNVAYAENNQRALEQKEIDGINYTILRWMDDHFFYKKILIDNHIDAPLEHIEKVAKFIAADFARMLAPHRLTIKETFGDYMLNEHSSKSPRLIMIIKKA